MARYRGVLQGNQGEVSRLGSPSSGLRAQANGWDTGAQIHVYPDADNPDLDRVDVYRTSGSNGARREQLVASWTQGRPTVHSL